MWHDNPMLVLEDNDVVLALHIRDLRKQESRVVFWIPACADVTLFE